MKIRHTGREDKIQLQMTPMIDIVFQLLIFFIMTFKIVLPEGDFNIRMPSAATTTFAQPTETPLLTLKLKANPDGSLASLAMGKRSLPDFQALRNHIRGLIGSAGNH